MESQVQNKTYSWQNYKFLVLTSGAVIFFDQLTKYLVRTQLALEETWVPWPWVDRFGRIVHWKNEESAFNWLSWDRWIFVLIAILFTLAIIYYFPRIPKHDWTFRLSMGLLMGGIIGNNLIDRPIFGYVTDFIMIGYGNVFNLADVSNFAGLIILCVGYLLDERKKKSEINGSET